MNWLKKNPFFQKPKRTWVIRVHRSGTWGFIEVTDHKIGKYLPQLFFDLLEDVFGPYKAIGLSQKIDMKQWHIDDRKQFLAKIQQNVSTEIKITSDFDSTIPPKDTGEVFVINLLTAFNHNLWIQVFRRGGFNLPNISFAFDEQLANWNEEIFSLNKIIYSWQYLRQN